MTVTSRSPEFLPHMWVYTAQVGELFVRIGQHLLDLGYELEQKIDSPTGANYMYAKGTMPVLLVGHLDTVHARPPVVKEIIVKDGSAAAPGIGLGADDRSGVAGILELLKMGHRPHVLFLDKEERGCIGAKAAAVALKAPEVKYMIELDRRGCDDAVYYSCANPEFEKYVTAAGFKTDIGSCSDISELMPKFGIAGVNFSIGYYGAHGAGESLKIMEWWKTIDRVDQMLQNPPTESFKYIAKPVTTYSGAGYGTGVTNYGTEGWNEENWLKSNKEEIVVRVPIEDLVWTLGYSAETVAAVLGAHKFEIESLAREFIWAQLIKRVDDQVGITMISADDLRRAEELAAMG